MAKRQVFSVINGLATIRHHLVDVRDLLEAQFLRWAAECGAEKMILPPLMSVGDLSNLDYFRNFPHLASAVSRIREEKLTDDYARGGNITALPNSHLTDSEYVLPSAACYNVYIYLRNTLLAKPGYFTTVATCFRNEVEYEGLQRLWAFTMREIVCLGHIDAVQAHLISFKARIQSFTNRIGLPLEIQAATDPFYEPQGSRAIMQKLFPVKEEFVYRGSVAIASVNFHRNFFGERCSIRTADNEACFSGCVAFGIERWLHALLDHFDGDVERITRAIKSI
jgi:seryl-tRNA synthetase